MRQMRWARTILLSFLAAAALPLSPHAAAAAEEGEHKDRGGGKDHFVVAADGSGDFKTVQDAVDAVPMNNTRRVTIEIRPGTYEERVIIPARKPLIAFVGTNAEKTILRYWLNARTPDAKGRPIGTSNSASTMIEADDFLAENVTFENTTGRDGGQALAVRVSGDRAVFRNCRFLGWQDTVLLNHNRQYFEGCYVAGHVDFIFGEATAFFENCHIHCRAPGFITAASTQQETPFGFVFRGCRITAGEDIPAWSVYLGRPWRPYGSVTYIDTEVPAAIHPAGWDNWANPENEKTARFAEFGSTGPGAKAEARAKWAKRLTEEEAKAYTPQHVLGGKDNWDPKSARRDGGDKRPDR